MNRKEIAAHLNSAITQLVPDLFDIVANTPVIKMEKHDYVTRQEEAEKPKYRLQLIAACVGVMLIMVVFAGWFQFYAVESVITLDINPSMEITTNRRNHVLRMQAHNDDGSLLFNDPDIKNKDLNTSVKNIFSSILQMGYMGNADDIVLVSVQSKNADSAVKLQNRITKDIIAFLKETNTEALLLRQTILPDNKLKKLGAEYNISLGKSNLIRQMAACDSALNIADLAPLSLQELMQVIKEQEIELKEIGLDGIDIRISAYDGAYDSAGDEARPPVPGNGNGNGKGAAGNGGGNDSGADGAVNDDGVVAADEEEEDEDDLEAGDEEEVDDDDEEDDELDDKDEDDLEAEDDEEPEDDDDEDDNEDDENDDEEDDEGEGDGLND
jgi:hypothetical protein